MTIVEELAMAYDGSFASVEEPLPGGFLNVVVRTGQVVRRPLPTAADYTHQVLSLLEERDWPGAPRLLGIDERGREMLTYLEGFVPWESENQPAVRSDAALVAVARLVRELHDLTAGSALAAGGEVVCHNDLSPKNTVYRQVDARWLPVAFLDWDNAAAGQRVYDLAHTCWQYIGLGPALPSAKRAAASVRLIADAYGLVDRSALISTILWWQDRCWRGIEARADTGDPAMVRLRNLGVAAEVRSAYDWTAAHRTELDAALR
ncbi:phosphotransferase family protein [Cryptosporangium sp. NPDC048952]|uniref:phosphotransferase family protein n=1 Tax=Cryptosporangium sp. NPDC048952 TaxID=3363961 RepID=UPI00371FDD9E